MSTNITLPNPYTPLAFLDPTLAYQFEVSRYLYAVTLGLYLWDIATNLPSDYRLLFRSRLSYATFTYWLSRIFTLAYILTCFTFQVADVADCQALQRGLGACFVLAQSFTSLLFLLRVTAVWNGNMPVNVVFTLLWLGVTLSAITIPLGIVGEHIGPTQKCINVKVPVLAEIAAIFGLVNDTAILFMISYKIVKGCTHQESLKAQVGAFFGRGHIPPFSHALLQGGQHYYLIAVGGNIVLLVFVKDPSVPAVYNGMCTIPFIAVVNAMACIVFRKIKFGTMAHDGTPHLSSSRRTDHSLTNSLPLHHRRGQGSEQTDTKLVNVLKTVQTEAFGDETGSVNLKHSDVTSLLGGRAA